MSQTSLQIVALTPNIGAEVRGATISSILENPGGAQANGALEAIRQALSRHLVLFFRNQFDLTPEMQVDFASRFGPIETHGYTTVHPTHPEVTVLDVTQPVGLGTDAWHSDSSGKAEPALGAVLRAVSLPPFGGDTCWASMYAAYESLSFAYQRFLDPLTALHDFARPLESAIAAGYQSPTPLHEVRAANPPAEHPVVRTHPVTGRRGLYVNGNYTTRICQLEPAESDAVLATLYEHIKKPEFHVRFHWEPNDVALWDNRCTQHYAVADYSGHRRIMHRVSIQGDRPT